MLLKLIITITLITITVSIHAFGIAALLRALIKSDRWEKKQGVKSFSTTSDFSPWLLI